MSRADGTLEQTIGGTTAVSADEMHCRKYDAPLILKMVLIVINLVPESMIYFFRAVSPRSNTQVEYQDNDPYRRGKRRDQREKNPNRR